jgi:CBS domain containing-hemolysin-like protein
VSLLSSIEAALVGVTESKVRHAMDNDVPGAERLQVWLEHADRILVTLRLGQLLLVSGAILALRALLPHIGFPGNHALNAGVLGALSLLSCHLVVRPVANLYALEWAKATLWLVRGMVFILSPVVVPSELIGKGLSKAFGPSSRLPGAFWTAQGLEKVAADARVNLIGEPGEQLMDSIISFSDTVIREIMVPRTEMVAISGDISREALCDLLIEAGHSRIPVFDDTVDNIVGVLHVKDFFVGEIRSGGKPLEVEKLVRPPFYVPEVMKISELLRDFQRRKTHLAIVVDEYGGTAGVVTLEDIIEEIVGEIQDEYDVDEKQYRRVGEHKIIADGRVNLGDLEDIWEVEFPEDGGYETLAGFLMAQAGYLPEAGTCIRWRNLVFTVKEANEKRIEMVEVEWKEGGRTPPARVA